jgi:hypothetical protein
MFQELVSIVGFNYMMILMGFSQNQIETIGHCTIKE